MTKYPRYLLTQRSNHRSDPAVVSVETPPRRNVGANDVAASIEYLRAKERALQRPR